MQELCPVMWTYDICSFDTGTYYVNKSSASVSPDLKALDKCVIIIIIIIIDKITIFYILQWCKQNKHFRRILGNKYSTFSGPMLGNCPFLLINAVYEISVESHIILMVAPYLLCHIPVTWGSLFQATCLLLYILQTLFPRPTNELVKYSIHSHLEIFTYLCVLSWFMYVLLSNITQLFGHPLYCPWYWCCGISTTSFHQKTSYSKEFVLSRTSKMFKYI